MFAGFDRAPEERLIGVIAAILEGREGIRRIAWKEIRRTPADHWRRTFFLFLGWRGRTRRAPVIPFQLTRFTVQVPPAWQPAVAVAVPVSVG